MGFFNQNALGFQFSKINKWSHLVWYSNLVKTYQQWLSLIAFGRCRVNLSSSNTYNVDWYVEGNWSWTNSVSLTPIKIELLTNLQSKKNY